MGWLFSGWRTTGEIRDTLNKEIGSLEIVDQRMTNYGRHIWTLYQTPTGERFINLDLCKKLAGEWGYKSIMETMGPYYYDCPLTLIRKAGATLNPTAQTWRDAVEAYHARRTRKLTAGMKIRMYGKSYTVESVSRQTTIRRDDGCLFRLSRRNMENLEIVG